MFFLNKLFEINELAAFYPLNQKNVCMAETITEVYNH